MKLTVLGPGCWGLTLAWLLTNNFDEVTVWGRESDISEDLAKSYKDLALNDKDLLEAVVHFKQKFYRETWMDYSDILANGIRLVPDDYRFKAL